MVEQMRRQIAEQDQTGDETRTADIHILACAIYYECAAAVYVVESGRQYRQTHFLGYLFTRAFRPRVPAYLLLIFTADSAYL